MPEPDPGARPGGDPASGDPPIEPAGCRHGHSAAKIAAFRAALAAGADRMHWCEVCARAAHTGQAPGGGGGGGKGKGKKSKNKKRKAAQARRRLLAQVPAWVCLTCGHAGCGRSAPHRHALAHFEAHPQHAVAMDAHTTQAWCYKCDDEVGEDAAVEACRALLLTAAAAGAESSGSDTDGAPTPDGPPTPPTTTGWPSEAGPAATPESKPESKPTAGPPRGLRNLGNTCFFNTALQNLARTDALRAALLDGGRDVHDYGAMHSALRSAMTAIIEPAKAPQPTGRYHKKGKNKHKSQGGGAYSPDRLLAAARRRSSQFQGYRQQDSHELFLCVVDGLHEEHQAYERDDEENPEWRSVVTTARGAFGNTLCSTVVCACCGQRSRTFEECYDVSLSIPGADAEDADDAGWWGQSKKARRRAAQAQGGGQKAQKLSKKQRRKLEKQKRQEAIKAALYEDSSTPTSSPMAGSPPAQAEPAQAEPALPADQVAAQFMAALTNAAEAAAAADDAAEAAAAERFAALERRRDEAFRRRKARRERPALDVAGSSKREIVAHLQTYAEPAWLEERKLHGDVKKVAKTLSRQALEELVEQLAGPPVIVQPPSVGRAAEPSVGRAAEPSVGRAAEPSVGRAAEPSVVAEPEPEPEPPQTTEDDGFSSPPVAEPLPVGAPLTIERLLGEFTRPEQLQVASGNGYYCEGCDATVDATKRLLLHRPPPVLALHLKRLRQFSKVSTPVAFGAVLDVAPFVLAEDARGLGSTRYRLFGISVHQGGMGGGHYVAYVRDRVDADRWYCASDASVSPCDEERALRAEAYMLFYSLESESGGGGAGAAGAAEDGVAEPEAGGEEAEDLGVE